MSDTDSIYNHPIDNKSAENAATTPGTQPPPTPADKYQLYIRIAVMIAIVAGFPTIFLKIVGVINIPNEALCFLLIILMIVLATMNWLKEKNNQTPIIVLIVATIVVIIVNSIWPGLNLNQVGKSSQTIPLPRDLEWMSREIKPTPEKIVRVYSGDKFVYKASSGFWVMEEGGPRHFHNPSLTQNEIRSFTFYDLPAEGRIIKIQKGKGGTTFWMDFKIVRG